MNIDFHHTVTFLVARVAGFGVEDAEIIAHAAQYVDDATNDGLVRFDNGAMYSRCATAHKMLDYKNFAALATHRVWVPFHFVPGGASSGDKFIDRLVCRPNSPVLKSLVRSAIADADRPYGLHRLGITAHAFVDSWAHQGFAGVNHVINQVHRVSRDGKIDENYQRKVANFFNGLLQQRMPPLGHGAALSYPDRPYLRWSYFNGRDEEIFRDNPRDFTEAADELCKVFRRFRLREAGADVEGLPAPIRAKINRFFETATDASEHRRHQRWLAALRDDVFGIGAVDIQYNDKGMNSWKHLALGTIDKNDASETIFPFSPLFARSDWKRFHDAAKAHRRSLVDDVLSDFGIIVA